MVSILTEMFIRNLLTLKGNIDAYGYFGTDEFGGFDKYIIADEMKSGNYTLRFFDDKIMTLSKIKRIRSYTTLSNTL